MSREMVSDPYYVRASSELIAAYVDMPFTASGTEGFGRSDRRGVAVRHRVQSDRSLVSLQRMFRKAASGMTLRVHSDRCRKPR